MWRRSGDVHQEWTGNQQLTAKLTGLTQSQKTVLKREVWKKHSRFTSMAPVNKCEHGRENMGNHDMANYRYKNRRTLIESVWHWLKNATFVWLLYCLNNRVGHATIKYTHFKAHQRAVRQIPGLCSALNPCRNFVWHEWQITRNPWTDRKNSSETHDSRIRQCKYLDSMRRGTNGWRGAVNGKGWER